MPRFFISAGECAYLSIGKFCAPSDFPYGFSGQVLEELRTKMHPSPFHMSWVDATCHSEFAMSFEVSQDRVSKPHDLKEQGLLAWILRSSCSRSWHLA
jgi:hypothetical protein